MENTKVKIKKGILWEGYTDAESEFVMHAGTINRLYYYPMTNGSEWRWHTGDEDGPFKVVFAEDFAQVTFPTSWENPASLKDAEEWVFARLDQGHNLKVTGHQIFRGSPSMPCHVRVTLRAVQ